MEERKIIEQAGMDMIYLTACTLHSQKPEIPEIGKRGSLYNGMLYKMAYFHSLTAVVADALEIGGFLYRLGLYRGGASKAGNVNF